MPQSLSELNLAVKCLNFFGSLTRYILKIKYKNRSHFDLHGISGVDELRMAEGISETSFQQRNVSKKLR